MKRVPGKCETCQDETRREVISVGPDTGMKPKTKWFCKNYDCNAFSKEHLFPHDTMPEKPEKKEKAPAVKKTTTAKKTTAKKAVKK